MRVPPVDIVPLADLVRNQPALRLVLLNSVPAIRSAQLQKAVASSGEVYFDIATVEGAGGVGRLLEQVPLERVLFGSHYPFFYFESALLKMRESGLSHAEASRVLGGNARLLLTQASRA